MEEILKRPMRQGKTARLREAGGCWATRVDTLKETTNRLGGNFGIVIVAKEDCLHLDDGTDWKFIETLIPRDYFKRANRPVPDYEEYWGMVEDADGVERDRMLDAEGELFLSRHKDKINYIRGLPVGRIVDVGCGRGFLFDAIKGWENYGVDISHQATGSLKNVVCGTLEDANYESDYFDVAVLSNIIEHVEDPIELLKETRRILKPNGKLILETPDFESGVAQRFGNKYRMLHDKGHINLFGLLGIHRLLLDSGFEVEKLMYPYFELDLFNEDNFRRLYDITKVSPPFLGNILTFYAYKK